LLTEWAWLAMKRRVLRYNDEIGYEGAHADRSLETRMLLSIETGIRHPQVGFIKLEDTVVVTDAGWEGRDS
jgi:Xaa-Pro dipeptidase